MQKIHFFSILVLCCFLSVAQIQKSQIASQVIPTLESWNKEGVNAATSERYDSTLGYTFSPADSLFSLAGKGEYEYLGGSTGDFAYLMYTWDSLTNRYPAGV